MDTVDTSPLVHQLIETIAESGPMPFDHFMQHALYAPGLGYYSSGQQKFGEAGDFITAPEISPLFSQCLARHCQPILASFNAPKVLEFGAGSGVMAANILLALEQLGQLPDAYWIVELSAELMSRQRRLIQEKAPHLLSRVAWLSALPSEPFEGIVLANEVLDAMPVNKFRWQEGVLQAASVGYAAGQFVWHWQPASVALSQAVDALAVDFSDGYESELNLFIQGWIRSVSQCLSRGTVLLIDYGYPRNEYYHPDRSTGTLTCFHRHRSHHDPLQQVGQQDITAHVDFTAVAMAAVECGLDVAGYTHQAAFLIDCGISDVLSDIADSTDFFNASQQVKQLTLPGEMGELFKVMALSQSFDDDLPGFGLLDLSLRL